ncbi:MAG TPA: hypothetical protein VKV69_07300, partial [Actinomycetota bacterium]|nr:hypothetical protein [Actinomycetota bacterium]
NPVKRYWWRLHHRQQHWRRRPHHHDYVPGSYQLGGSGWPHDHDDVPLTTRGKIIYYSLVMLLIAGVILVIASHQ